MKALIVYGTRYGSAAEISQKIGNILRKENVEVDVVDSKGSINCDITPYDLVIVGSGIKIGSWTKPALKFMEKHENELKDKKVALFVSCSANRDEKSIKEAKEKYLDNVADKYLKNPPVASGLFGGVIDPNAKLGLMDKVIFKMVKKDLESKGIDTSKPYDTRDWDQIHKWAQDLIKN
ncbi:MAG: flavodoxin domain-containing protein [Methanobacteriaceae archaeon]|jgi:menaquinone-dependent protoporphyrinogen oxidase|nr:flavodoxin domain-containing protein [Methanobacteriaceae archaeon]